MRHVEDHRISQLAHDRKRPHVHHEILIAKRSSPLGENNLLVSRARDLFRGVRDVPRRKELALLDIGHAARPADGNQQIRLPRKERWNLQHVADLRRRRDMRDFVHIGQDRQPRALLDLSENASPSLSPGPRKDETDDRLALSYDALKISGTLTAPAISPRRSAMDMACASLSITHGPAIRNSGALAPNAIFPTEKLTGDLAPADSMERLTSS